MKENVIELLGLINVFLGEFFCVLNYDFFISILLFD